MSISISALSIIHNEIEHMDATPMDFIEFGVKAYGKATAILIDKDHADKLKSIELSTGMDGEDKVIESLIDFYLDAKKSMMLNNLI